VSQSAAGTRELPGRLPALDGLRGIAVSLVVVSHFPTVVSPDPAFVDVTPWVLVNQALSRGFLGVDLFFVISGFLITSLLLKPVDSSVPHRLRSFYARRALRLLPALLVLLAASSIIAAWENFPSDKQWRSTWRALLFVSNIDPEGVFLRTQADIGHLWSLAVEEQFYLVWPLVVLVLGLRRARPAVQINVAIVAIIAVTIHRFSMWNGGLEWLFAYQRTDTRIDTILMGCLAAFVYRTGRPGQKTVATSAAVAAVAIWPLAHAYANVRSDFLYIGGFTLIAGMFALVVLWCAGDSASDVRILTSGPLPAIGKVSYGLYLYHLLVFRVFERHVTFGSDWTRIGLAIAVSAVVSVLSWTFVEQPFLRLKDQRFSESVRQAS